MSTRQELTTGLTTVESVDFQFRLSPSTFNSDSWVFVIDISAHLAPWSWVFVIPSHGWRLWVQNLKELQDSLVMYPSLYNMSSINEKWIFSGSVLVLIFDTWTGLNPKDLVVSNHQGLPHSTTWDYMTQDVERNHGGKWTDMSNLSLKKINEIVGLMKHRDHTRARVCSWQNIIRSLEEVREIQEWHSHEDTLYPGKEKK